MTPDIRQAVRNLLRTPAFTLVAVITLALGIGANAAIFSVVNGVVLRPLGYPEPDRLVYITSQFPSLGFDQFWVSPPEYLELSERQHSFEAIGAYNTGQDNVAASDRPRRVVAANVTASLFDVLGVKPARGRAIQPGDMLTGSAPVVVLSHELWMSAFGGDGAIVGRPIEVDGGRPTVVGIMPPGFDIGDDRVELFEPLTLDGNVRQGRSNHFLYLVGRLRTGSTMTAARADLETLLAQWRQVTPEGHVPNQKGHRLRYDGYQEQIVGGARRAVWVLQAAVGFVLLIACANLANLLLARAESRQREFATRLALGATRGRLLRQFLTEGLVLSAAGAVLGLLIAAMGVPAMLASLRDSLPRAPHVSVDVVVVAFTIGVALLTGLAFGFAPLLHLGDATVAHTLRDGMTRTTSGSASQRLRKVFVAAEVALAVVLVAGAGLMLRTMWNLARVDAGFDRSRLVTFAVALPPVRYQQPQDAQAFYARLLDGLKALPGVQGAAAMSGLPPLRDVNANDTDIESYVTPVSNGQPTGPLENVDYWQIVTTQYVETLGIPIVDGRGFQPSDEQGGPVVLVNETMARTFWTKRSPIGDRIRPGFGDQLPWYTVVGVVKDVKQGGVDRKTGTELYFHAGQAARISQFASRTMNVVMRTALPASALDGSIRQVVQRLDPSLPIVRLRGMDEVFAESTQRTQLLARMLAAFGALALFLAALGTYGVLSYVVAQRRREIGIRVALGAERGQVMRLVMRQGLVMAGAGVLAGLVGVFLLDRVMGALLFGVRGSDPLTLVSVVVSLSAAAALACFVPARRATRVDPMVVLRDE
jgi:putative ABC transport system permease protein